MEPRGLKNRILNLMWKFVNKSFNTQKYLHVATVLRLSPMQKFTEYFLKAKLKGQMCKQYSRVRGKTQGCSEYVNKEKKEQIIQNCTKGNVAKK